MDKVITPETDIIFDPQYSKSNAEGSYQQKLANELKQSMADSNKPWRQLMNLRLIGKETRTSQKGNEYTTMLYQVKDCDDSNWEDKKTPIYTDEAKLILEAIDYNEESVYLLTYEKGSNGYTSITQIERIEEEDTNVSAETEGELV